MPSQLAASLELELELVKVQQLDFEREGVVGK